MLSERRAARLARHAGHWRADGTRGPRARSALRRLARDADRGNYWVTRALLGEWLHTLDEEGWQLVNRWAVPPWGAASIADRVVSEAVRPDRAPGERAAIGDFCRRHGLFPGEETQRALFHLMTGQAEACQAADPDGSLLAAAYQSADKAMRLAIQAALARNGLMDLAVRVVARRPAGAAAASAAETDLLVGKLVGRRDWAGLWRLGQALPLTGSVAVAQLIGDDWSPAEEAGRRIFGLLASTQPGTIAAFGARAVSTIRVKRDSDIRILGPVFFSPDESEVGVVDGSHRVRVYSVADGRRVRESFSAGDKLGDILHLGDAVVYSRRTELGDRCRVVRRRWGGPREVLLKANGLPEPVLAHTAGGFVAAHAARLWFGARSGPWQRTVGLTELDMGWSVGGSAHVTGIATDTVSGRLALAVRETHVTGPTHLTVLGNDLQLVGHAAVDSTGWPDSFATTWLGFWGPDRLITKAGHSVLVQYDRYVDVIDQRTEEEWSVASWRVGPPLTCEATRPVGEYHRMNPLRRLGIVACHDLNGVEFRDPRTLDQVAGPPALRRACYVSPQGGYAAAPFFTVEVHDLRLAEVAAILEKPLASARPADLVTVQDAQAHDISAEVNATLRLLRACLEYRFGSDVALGDSMPPTAGAPDIAL